MINTFYRRWLVAAALLALCWAGCARRTMPMLAYNESEAKAKRAVLDSGSEGRAGGTAALAEPTGWATITGSFKLNGPAPPQDALTVNKDVEVCAPGGRQVLAENVVVGADDGLKNVLLFISSTIPADNPAWVHESYEASRTGEVEFDQKNCVFLEHVAAMRDTQTLKVLNSDPVGHNTNLDSKRGAAAANFLVAAHGYDYYRPGAPSPAPFPVTCSIHPWMKAWMMVCGHPYFAVTREDGSFEIANVPAGVKLEFRVWQETAGYLEQVNVNGQADKWSKGKFKVTLSPDERLEMNVVVDNSVF